MHTKIYMRASQYNDCGLSLCENNNHINFTLWVLFFIAVCVVLVVEIIKNKKNDGKHRRGKH